MDYSRLTPQQIAMQSAKEKYQKQKEQEQDNQDQLRKRQQTQNGTGYRNIHDLAKSDFHKTTIQTFPFLCDSTTFSINSIPLTPSFIVGYSPSKATSPLKAFATPL